MSQTGRSGNAHMHLRVVGLFCLTVVLSAAITLVIAGKTRGRWYIGGAVAFHSTEDAIRNNASLEGDPRPANFASRETTIDDGVAYGLSVGYGVTSWFSLELDVGYFQGSVGSIDAYLEYDSLPTPGISNPNLYTRIGSRETSIPVNAGELTELPVTLSGYFRFRTDRQLNPYIGGGVGIVYTQFDVSGELPALQSRLESLHITNVKNELGVTIRPEEFKHLGVHGEIPFIWPVQIDIEDGFQFHISAGMEYFFGDRMSLIADLRYQSTKSKLSITFAGEDQLNLAIFPEELFREDGSLLLFNDRSLAPNPHIDNDPNNPIVDCDTNTIGDFDNDGQDDVCFAGERTTPQGRLVIDPRGTFVVQGGEIDLSGYKISLGLRLYF